MDGRQTPSDGNTSANKNTLCHTKTIITTGNQKKNIVASHKNKSSTVCKGSHELKQTY